MDPRRVINATPFKPSQEDLDEISKLAKSVNMHFVPHGTPKVTSDGGSTSYYQLPDDAKELGDLIEFKNMNFNVGNIFKASYRLGDKDGNTLEYDLNKIIWFAQRELRRLKRKNT